MNILIGTNSYFPYGMAISHRIRVFCMLFHDLGMNVHVISLYYPPVLHAASQDYNLDCCTYECLHQGKKKSISSFVKHKDFIQSIENYLINNKVDCIFLTQCDNDFLSIAKIAKRMRIHIYVEQCEWYDISTYKFWRIDPRYIRENFLKRFGYKKADGIISISRLLNDHYQSIGQQSIRIPTILDVKNIPQNVKKGMDGIISIVYTGKPGKSKELLSPIIKCLVYNKSIFREKIVFHIYGPSKKKVILNIGKDKSLLEDVDNYIIIHEEIPQTKVEEIIRNAHYLIFIRPDRRSSNAGFPTKLGESMAVGTPIIANVTGDIGLYLKNGQNGFIIADYSLETIKNIFEKIISLSQDEYKQMRINARKTAEAFFDYRNYYDTIKCFLGKQFCSDLVDNV